MHIGKYSNIKVYKYKDVKIYTYLDIQIWKYTNRQNCTKSHAPRPPSPLTEDVSAKPEVFKTVETVFSC